MNKWAELLLGLLLVIAVVLLVFPGMPMAAWGSAALIVLKGGLTWIVLLVGLLLIILGISEMRG